MQNLCKNKWPILKSTFYGYNNKDFSQTLSSVLSAVYKTQRDYLSEVPAGSCKVKSLSIALIIVYFCGARRSRRFAGIPPKIVILICILAILARILVWRLHFLFLWNNGARKSHAKQQTLKVRNVLSEVFVDPVLKITLVRSLTINVGRRRKMQAAPKMITYLYKVVCFFLLQGNFHSVFGDLYFAALNKLV